MDINATLFGQMITFAIFVWFTMKVVWPILEQQLEERKKRIADGLVAAEKGHQLLKDAEKEIKERLVETKNHAEQIIAEAERQSLEIIEEARQQALKEREDIVNSGNAEVAQAIHKAKSDLQKQLAGLVISGAEKIIKRSVNENDHQELLADLIKDL